MEKFTENLRNQILGYEAERGEWSSCGQRVGGGGKTGPGNGPAAVVVPAAVPRRSREGGARSRQLPRRSLGELHHQPSHA